MHQVVAYAHRAGPAGSSPPPRAGHVAGPSARENFLYSFKVEHDTDKEPGKRMTTPQDVFNRHESSLFMQRPVLNSVIVESLLGDFDHRIDFPESWDYVIIYGPNGVGKTRLLEVVQATLSLNLRVIASIPFARLTLSFSDGHRIDVSRAPESPSLFDDFSFHAKGRIGAPIYSYNYTLLRGGDRIATFLVGEKSAGVSVATQVMNETPWRPLEGDLWEDQTDGEITSFDELLERYGRLLRSRPKSTESQVPEEIQAYTNGIGCHLIATQRLVTRQRRPSDSPRQRSSSRPTVEAYSDDLRRRLNSALAANSRFTQTLDRTFPRRILERRLGLLTETDDDIRMRYVEQNELREKLSSLGLIDAEPELPLPERDLEDWERYVLATYLNDTDQKLDTFRGLLEKISLLEEIVNSRFLRKVLSVDTEGGLTIRKSGTREVVQLESLSSGEQHEIILFYGLLFNSDKDSIVLIDEPEISLHVVWQQRFLYDLSRVAKAASLRFIVATHSPQLIHKSWHRTVELAGSDELF